MRARTTVSATVFPKHSAPSGIRRGVEEGGGGGGGGGPPPPPPPPSFPSRLFMLLLAAGMIVPREASGH